MTDRRLVLVNWDVHHGDLVHGNGTQDVVGRDPLLLEGVLFVSSTDTLVWLMASSRNSGQSQARLAK
jgi:hypothetical protein